MKRLKKMISVTQRIIIQQLQYVNMRIYMKQYMKYLKKHGMNIEGIPNYIGNTVYFDGKDYSYITIGNGVTISRGAILLTHDYSMHTVHKNLDLVNIEKVKQKDKENFCLIFQPIKIGQYSFVGKGAILLPGTTIGENVLVGAGSVVRGNIPDNSVVIGNPAKIVTQTSDWIDKKILSL